MKRTLLAACTLLLSFSAVTADQSGVELSDQDFSEFFSSYQCESPEQVERNLNAFASHLNLNENQQDAWYRFKITFLEQVENHRQRHNILVTLNKNRNNTESLSHLKLQERYLQVRLKELQEMIEVVNNLYTQLNKHQKTQFDRAMQYFWSGHHSAHTFQQLSEHR